MNSGKISEIERVLNSRPLTLSGQYDVITPALILGGGQPNYENDFTGIEKDAIYEEVLRERNELPHLYRLAKERLAIFWKALWEQYLSLLRFSADKMCNKFKKKPKIGDLCIVWHKDDPRKKWKKAIILDLFSSADGNIRQCKIKVSTGVMIRPVNQLYSLELNAESFSEEKEQKEQEQEEMLETEDSQQGTSEIIQQSSTESRPRRAAALAAMHRNREIMLDEQYIN